MEIISGNYFLFVEISENFLREEEYVPCLDQFVQLLDFGGLEFDMALRRFLLRFRLPGEAQKIDRIMERYPF